MRNWNTPMNFHHLRIEQMQTIYSKCKGGKKGGNKSGGKKRPKGY